MNKNKTAIIVGSGGQDGKILFHFLKKKNYNILGITRAGNTIHGLISYNEHAINILDKKAVGSLIKTLVPDELYYLAAYHHSSQDNVPSDEELFMKSKEIHVDGYFNMLQAIQKYSPHTKICYASSCLIYAGTNTSQQDESTLPIPNSPYGITKLEGMHIGNWFAEKYNLQIVNVILYNHESEYRSHKFVSMKIIQGAINISKYLQDKIVLGDLSTQVDRGYAGDYIKSMRGLLQSDKKGDYIVSSGKLHTIQELVTIIFDYFGLDWKKYIVSDADIVKRKRGELFGNHNKITQDIGRNPTLGFREMIISIIEKKLIS